MFCENCGMELQDPNQKFCPNCSIPQKIMKLDSEECYIIVSDFTKVIYLWKGLRSSVRSGFLASKRVQETRDRLGAEYSINTILEGQEDSEFLNQVFKSIFKIDWELR